MSSSDLSCEIETTELAFYASQVDTSQSRTSIDPDDMATTRWATDDELHIWSFNDSGYVFENATFRLRSYSADYSQATFASWDVLPMDEGRYTYFGVSPAPVSVDGTDVSYTISTTQSGQYDGQNDIMAMSPVVGDALAKEPNKDLSFAYSHLTHAIRINIPEGRNLFGRPINKLVITFPNDVVGDVRVDASSADPQLEMVNGSSVVTLDMGDYEIDEESNYAWLFICPTTLSGEMTFTAYNRDGYCMELLTTTIEDMELKSGRVTPLTLTIPHSVPTDVTVNIGDNNLGEQIQYITLTAPGNSIFTNGGSEWTQPYNDSGEYTFSYRVEDSEDGFMEGGIGVKFESENAIVYGADIAVEDLVVSQNNSITLDVPYLFAQDFSGVSTFSSYDDPGTSSAGTGKTLTLTDYGLSGWTADRAGASEGKSLRTMCRLEGGFWVQAVYRGRIDSAPLSAIKSGKSVGITVSYNCSGALYEGTGSSTGTPKFTHGYTDDTGELDGGDSIENTVGSEMEQGTTGSYSSVGNFKTYDVDSGITSSMRLSWRASVSRSNEFAQNGNYWLYIDDITVSIK